MLTYASHGYVVNLSLVQASWFQMLAGVGECRHLTGRSTSFDSPQDLDAGLAVADNGARVFIVGGRAELNMGLSHPCIIPHDRHPCISAEVFELNLGQRLLGSDPLSPTARWRQV